LFIRLTILPLYQRIQTTTMNKQTSKKAIALLKEVETMSTKWKDEIHSICEELDYHESSKFSYNIDRMKPFVDGLRETANKSNHQ